MRKETVNVFHLSFKYSLAFGALAGESLSPLTQQSWRAHEANENVF